jgi:hypothetical protein
MIKRGLRIDDDSDTEVRNEEKVSICIFIHRLGCKSKKVQFREGYG